MQSSLPTESLPGDLHCVLQARQKGDHHTLWSQVLSLCLVTGTSLFSIDNSPTFSSFQRTLQTNKVAFNVFDKSNLLFSDLHNTLDVVCIDLREKGVDYM